MHRWLMSIVLLAACARLPSDWGNAAVAENFTQSECTGNLGDLATRGGEQFTVQQTGEGRLRIEYRNAHFRCEQRVTGYVKRNGSAVDVLVQPSDMSPSSVAKCACLYTIQLEVPRLAPGTYAITLHRRGDSRNPPEPVRIGSEQVMVR